MTHDDNAGSFISRWSSRKRQQRVPPVLEEATRDSGSVDTNVTPLEPYVADIDGLPVAEHDVGVANRSQPGTPAADDGVGPVPDAPANDPADPQGEPLLTDSDMPPIESLHASSDVSGFFNKGVSAALRKAALRHVFQQPQFNVRDGLNDYDGDYTVFEPLGDTITADMKFHAARKERDRLAAEAEQEKLAAEAEVEAVAHDDTRADSDDADAESATAQNQPSADGESSTDSAAESGSDSVATKNEEGVGLEAPENTGADLADAGDTESLADVPSNAMSSSPEKTV